MVWLALLLPWTLAQQPVVPLPRNGNCPLGYGASGAYCVPNPGGGSQSRGAIERPTGSTCPLGFTASGSYCVSNPGNQRQAIPREGTACPLGYLRSGSYCVQTPGPGR
jgi:hypothetical protein